jgi:hypothetical protein
MTAKRPSPEDDSDNQLINLWESFGVQWTPEKERVHDQLAARLKSRGIIRHPSGFTYRRSDDGSFTREKTAPKVYPPRKGPTSEARWQSFGRAVHDGGTRGSRGRSGQHGRESDSGHGA